MMHRRKAMRHPFPTPPRDPAMTLRRLRTVLRPFIPVVAVCLLAVPRVAVGAQADPSQDKADELARLRAMIGTGPDAALVLGAADEDVKLTPAEEAEIGPGGKRMAATPTLVAPTIDGLVDDEVWEAAEVVSDWLQREPVEAGTPSQRTEVRILYDDENIYVGFVMYDSEPDKIIASDLRRDSRLATDDTIAVLFDTYHDHRNGFLFRVNPQGTKYDATLKDESAINAQWDEKWEAAAQITADGWQAEMQIPWKVLRFDTGSHIWGVDFKREIRRNNEEINWSNYRRGFDFRHISNGGHLVGLRGLKLTERFRFKPYLSGGYTSLSATDDPLEQGDGDLGVEDFKYQVTPNLTADLSINTDFAQVEDDTERVNLTRFPLFFSERREFFLEGADKFQFGGANGFGTPLALLYHSRNIGLFQGNPVPMRYGAKITGKLGNTSVGFINAQTGDAFDLQYQGRNYSTLRVKQDVLGRSSIGAIVTNVEGGGDYNRVGGIDASFNFLDYLNLSGFIAQSRDSNVDGTEWIGSLRAGWNSDLWSVNASYDYIDPEFQTDMGFILRRDIKRQNYSLGWKPRPNLDWMRQLMVFGTVNYITGVDGAMQSRDQTFSTRFGMESGDSVNVSVTRNFERLELGFSPSGLASVPAGDYNFTDYRITLDTYRGRRLSGRLSVGLGDYYSGTRTSYSTGLSWRVNEKFSLGPTYNFNHIDLPTGEFSTHVGGLRAAYAFNERWLTSSLVQYNSVSERLSVFARLNYIYRTGDDFFLVFKSTTLFDEQFYGQSDRVLIAKATHSWDF